VYRKLGGTKGTRQEMEFIIFSMEKETKFLNWEQDFLVHHRRVSAAKRVEAVGDRVSYTIMRVRWCNTIAMNIQATSEEESDD
jgi:hypothetical protein